MEWNGMEWNGMEWNGMEWIEMVWNGMVNLTVHYVYTAGELQLSCQ